MRRKTIKEEKSLSGISLHSGKQATIRLSPAKSGCGICFFREDLPGRPKIPASPENISDTRRGTSISFKGATAQVVEHVLAAIQVLGISDVDLSLNGSEPPAMDGSSLPFLLALKDAGVTELGEDIAPLKIKKPLVVEEGQGIICAHPFDRLRISFVVNFEDACVGRQELSLDIDEAAFEKEIAPARTFGFIEEIEALKKQGLALGATIETALAVSRSGYVNKPRFADEVVRHKILDLIGDLALIGRPINAHFVAERSSHRLNARLTRMLAENA